LSEDVRSIVGRSGRAHRLLGNQSVTEETNEVIEAIAGGGDLPPEPAAHDHGDSGKGKPPSDTTVYVISALYIAGGAFMIWLGVSAIRSMNKRKKEQK
jgi:hypothetical protein